MSLIQTLLVLFVGLLITKPKDIPIIIKKIKNIKAYLYNNISLDNSSKTEQLNFYLQRIINIEGYYDGDYDLIAVKEKYNELVKSVIKDNCSIL